MLQQRSPYPLGQPAPSDVPEPKGSSTPVDLLEDHKQCVDFFTEWAWATVTEREMAFRDRDYYDNKQLTAEILEVLRKRGQPDIIINKIRAKMDYLKGMERKLRSDPKAFPRNPSDEPDSDAATQVLRFIADDNGYDQVRSAIWDNMLIEGVGGCDNTCENQDDGTVSIRCNHIQYGRLWWDPHSAKLNFGDARYLGSFVWMDLDEAESKYPDRKSEVNTPLIEAAEGDSIEDAPRRMMWADAKRRRIMIIQGQYKKRGDWYVATFTRGGFLVDPVISPYKDRRGKTSPSLRLRSMNKDRDNHNYGNVRLYIGMQDEINARRSKGLHIFSSRQIKYQAGAVQDIDATRAELSKPDGLIEINPGFEFEILPTGDMAAGNLELLRQVTEEFQVAGPNAAAMGKDPREQSGRAIQAQQLGGAVENEPSFDGLRQLNRENYQAWWMAAKMFWTHEQSLAITDEEDETDWVQINHPVTVAEMLSRMPDDQRAQVMQAQGFQPGDPRLQQVVKIENNISDLDVKITVEDGPDLSTLQAEQFNFLQNRPDAPLKILIKYGPFAKKSDMLKDLADIQQEQAAQQAQVQAHQLAMQQAEIGLKNAQATQSLAAAAEKQAGAVSRTHDMAMDHALVTAPDNAPAGHPWATQQTEDAAQQAQEQAEAQQQAAEAAQQQTQPTGVSP